MYRPPSKLTANLVGVEKARLAFFYIKNRYKNTDDDLLTLEVNMLIGRFTSFMFDRCLITRQEANILNKADEVWVGDNNTGSILVHNQKPSAFEAKGYYHWKKYYRNDHPRDARIGCEILSTIKRLFTPAEGNPQFWGYSISGTEIPE